MSGPFQNDQPKTRKTQIDFVPCRTLQNVATSSTGGHNRCSHRQAPVRQAGGPYSARSARAPSLIREQGGGALQLSTSDHDLSTDQRCAAQTCYQTAAALATMLQGVLIQLFASFRLKNRRAALPLFARNRCERWSRLSTRFRCHRFCRVQLVRPQSSKFRCCVQKFCV